MCNLRFQTRSRKRLFEVAHMPTGTIKWFDPRQSYGYIISDDGGPELFIHQSQWRSPAPPQDGQAVEFEVQSSRKGPIAVNVRQRQAAP